MKADEIKADDEMKANEKSQQYFFLNNYWASKENCNNDIKSNQFHIRASIVQDNNKIYLGWITFFLGLPDIEIIQHNLVLHVESETVLSWPHN